LDVGGLIGAREINQRPYYTIPRVVCPLPILLVVVVVLQLSCGLALHATNGIAFKVIVARSLWRRVGYGEKLRQECP